MVGVAEGQSRAGQHSLPNSNPGVGQFSTLPTQCSLPGDPEAMPTG